MSDDKKDDDGCEVTVTRHHPDCPVSKEFRELAQGMIDQAGEAADAENTGPAKWNSKAYKNGWEGVFGNKTVGQA